MPSEVDCKAVHDTFLGCRSGLHSVEQEQPQPQEGKQENSHRQQSTLALSGVQRVCICGAGHGGHTMAALIASKGISVSIYATRPQHVEKFKEDGLIVSAVYALEGRTVSGEVSVVTTDPEVAAKGADLVLVVVPTFLHEPILRAVVPFLRPGTPVVVVEGGWWGKPPLPGMESVSFFAMEVLPWACRVSSGHTATILGTKTSVRLGSTVPSATPTMCALLGELLEVSLEPVANLITLTFFAGLLVHPAVMYGLFSQWDGKPFEKAPLFYQGVTDQIEEVLLGFQADMFRVKAKVRELLPSMDLGRDETLHEWYLKCYSERIGDPTTLGSTLRTNAAYDGLVAPTKPNPNGEGRFPLFDHRYLSEDSELYLMLFRGIGELVGVETPMMNLVLEWSQGVLGREWIREGKLEGKDLGRTRAPQAFGILSKEAFLQSVQSKGPVFP